MQTPATILDWLTGKFPDAKKTTLRAMIEQKRVLLNGAFARSLKQPITPADRIEIGQAQFPAATLAEHLKVVYQDADLIVVDKPPGLLTSTHSAEPRPTVVAILNDYVQERNQKAQALLVHRLDRDASGLLVFARNSAAFAKLKEQFAAHTLDRQYTVLVHGVFRKPAGRLENFLFEDERGRVHVTKDPAKGKPALLDYQVLAAAGQTTRLRCTLHTGRKHQIRVQLQAIGHSVLGDPVYGTDAARRGTEPPLRLALHATHLAFTHPKTGKKIAFDSPAPAIFGTLVP